MHLPDRVVGRALTRTKMFGRGWGSLDALEGLFAAGLASAPLPVRPTLGRAWHDPGGVVRRRLTFPSPVPGLPPEAREAVVTLLSPARGEVRATCVVLAASGEHGDGRRRRLFAPLARRGAEIAILENPYYGARRPSGQTGGRVDTVLDQFRMNLATVEEGRGLAAWLRARHGVPVGVTGYSMGGYMAALTACALPFAVRVVPMAAGRCPAPVYTEGALSWAIDWPALERERPGSRELLRAAFRRAGDLLSTPAPGSRALLLAARDDGFVPAREVHRLHEAWPGSELRWTKGGHVSMWAVGAGAIRRALADALF